MLIRNSIFFLLSVLLVFYAEQAESQTIELLESNSERIVLDLKIPEGFLETVLRNLEENPEIEELFSIGRMIGLPPGKTAEINFAGDAQVKQGVSDELWYRIVENRPEKKAAIVTPTGGIRGLRTALLTLCPIVVDESDRSLIFYRSIRAVISFVDSEINREKINLGENHKEMIKELINGEKVSEWIREGKYGSSEILSKTSTDSVVWFEAGEIYYKLSVDREGLYVINKVFLEDTIGISTTSIDPRNIRIFNDGVEIPIYISGEEDGNFDTGDRIVFYGDWNRGEDSYYDLYTDVNTYWLKIDNEPGLRMQEVDVSPIQDAQGITSFLDTIHYEVDEDYFHGLTPSGLENTDYVAGERWTWQRFSSVYTLSRDFNFVTENKVDSGEHVDLKIAVTGYTAETSETTYRHHVEFFLNDQMVENIIFYGSADTILQFNVSNDLVNDGNNTLTITSIPSDDGRDDGFYLDWFEVIFPHELKTDESSLIIGSDFQDASNIIINGSFTESADPDSILVINAVETEVLNNISIVNNSSTIELTFSDQYAGYSRYLIYANNAMISPVFKKEVVFNDLWSSGNTADYLVIAHDKFFNQAVSFAEYRQGTHNFPNGIMVIDVEDIYDQYNYGVKDPRAIREFLTRTRDWTVMPEYVLFIGDASWDPKLNDPESEAIDYIPAYGYPVSDAWFAMTDGEDDIIPDLHIGRFPVSSNEEFENVFNKIIEYDSAEPDEWQKKLLFLNGGKTVFEQIMLRTAAETAGEYVSDHPFSGKDVYFNKTTTDVIEYGFKDEIIREINEGTLWVNSMGHASSVLYDVDFGTVDDLSNTGRYPFMVSMSCNTGRFANPNVISLSEKYILAKDKGAIAYFATTGWGKIHADNIMIIDFFKNVFEEGAESLGEAMTQAKIRIFDYSTSLSNINLVRQYSLMGDPALSLNFLKIPDYKMKEGDIILEEEEPTINDSPIEVKVLVRNNGYSVDNVIAVELFDITDPGNYEKIGETATLYKNGYIDSTSFSWNIVGRTGLRTLKAFVNRSGTVEEYSTLNNEATAQIRIFSTNALPYYPRDLSTVRTRKVTLKALVPKYRPADGTQLYFEVDTSLSFSSPLLNSEAVPEGEFLTGYPIILPADIEQEDPVYWRVRNVNDGVLSEWQTSVFYLDTTLGTDTERWRQAGNTFESGTFSNTIYVDSSGSVSLKKQPVLINAESGGFFDGFFHNLVIGGSEIESAPYDSSLLEIFTQGIYIAQIDRESGEVIDSYHFNTHYSEEHSTGLVSYISSIPDGRVVIAAVRDEAANNLTTEARNALKTIGSGLIDDLEWRDSWAIIGRKGAVPGTVKEDLNKSGDGKVGIQDSIFVYPTSGKYRSPLINGASSWKSLAVFIEMLSVYTENNVSVSLYGYNSLAGEWEKLLDYDNYMLLGEDLSNLAPEKYPELRLEANFNYLDSGPMPDLLGWVVDYKSGNDYYTNAARISLSSDTIVQGGNLELSGSIFRSVSGKVDTLALGITARKTGDKEYNLSLEHEIVFQITDTLKLFTYSIPTYGLSGSQEIYVEIDPENDEYELSESNNLGIVPVYFEDDPISPVIEITMDDKDVQEGDYVSEDPEVRITITENSGHTINDTALISLMLDDVPVSLLNNSRVNINYDAGASQTEILYYPQLDHGGHNLFVKASDRNSNQAQKEIEFIVASETRIEEFYPIPNPFSDKTYFTYKLSGDFEDASIKIYTVRGRLIRILDHAPTRAGFNRIEWDGKDQDGDRVANGVYICRILGRVGDSTFVLQTKVAVIR